MGRAPSVLADVSPGSQCTLSVPEQSILAPVSPLAADLGPWLGCFLSPFWGAPRALDSS